MPSTKTSKRTIDERNTNTTSTLPNAEKIRQALNAASSVHEPKSTSFASSNEIGSASSTTSTASDLVLRTKLSVKMFAIQSRDVIKTALSLVKDSICVFVRWIVRGARSIGKALKAGTAKAARSIGNGAAAFAASTRTAASSATHKAKNTACSVAKNAKRVASSTASATRTATSNAKTAISNTSAAAKNTLRSFSVNGGIKILGCILLCGSILAGCAFGYSAARSGAPVFVFQVQTENSVSMDENAISAEIAATNESTDEDSQAKNFNENASSNTSSASETSATSSKQPVMPFILLSNPDNGYRHQDGTWMYYDAMGQTCPQDCMFPSISDIVEKSGASLVYLLNKTSLSYTEERREGVPGGYWDFGRYSIAFSPTSGRVSASSQILTPERRLTRSQILELSYWEDSADLYVEGAWDGTLSMRDTISNIIGRELTVISGDAYTLDFQFLGSGYVYTGKATRVKDSGADREYKIMILIEATSADE